MKTDKEKLKQLLADFGIKDHGIDLCQSATIVFKFDANGMISN